MMITNNMFFKLTLLALAAADAVRANGARPSLRGENRQEEESLDLVGVQRRLDGRVPLPQFLDENMGNVEEQFRPERDTPFFWQIPKAGSTNALAYFTICMELTEASRNGLSARSDHLEIIEMDGHKYVNVDTTTQRGLAHARSLGLPASNMADVVSSAYAADVAEHLFDPVHHGKMFAIFRHPIERLASKFFYLREATWERTYNPEYQHMTIEQYARDPTMVGENWMTRMLVGKMEAKLVPDDLQIAKDILERKCLVGLMSQMEESLERFQRYFGWELTDGVRGKTFQTGEECKHSFFHPEETKGRKFNSHEHPKVERGSRDWDILATVVDYDLELYVHAVRLFDAQASLFRS